MDPPSLDIWIGIDRLSHLCDRYRDISSCRYLPVASVLHPLCISTVVLDVLVTCDSLTIGG